ncbi:UDP-glucose/GDP-mannose dehydrogenase family protein [Auritidibacter ignavus]|uniref:UDP-glucose dehydrogenase family protein n=1 Tax=Auritidibacter TaxID=1160973 RepID=UPI000D734826|nr:MULTISPECIES: UDP-glucose/GDP-mannose dehydrogenase family protein [Auritidibacter]PXA81724.1 UDP-glucose 6-dehydrogenase [Auritidibacter sp. NML120779]AXR74342.1 UDP-glucose/GDP-mannose dehydrogenase family protein [Auritidibacter sp. NML130574]WGH80835.1 UDP-glucose/GDP-mannose dehydrogenase family protein [Auritidibacter ignavus]WGH85450.1 UDP-glucose/GDP-mannose dehydrogenase family protein [Auritidibacter ignavus]WGH87736.1 UDP-glucose/GDP-mannose dehydrogenase family protein [Auritidi
MKISVIGCGYLGAVHAACMAELGHEVVGIDVDERRINGFVSGKLPFYEPGLSELIARQLGDRLSFSTDPAEIKQTEVHFICVGTPQLSAGRGADLSYVNQAVDTVLEQAQPGSLIAGKSTVPVGTAESLAERVVPAGFGLVWNPEFLREGFAIQDTLHPDRLVYGTMTPGAADTLDQVYAQLLEDGVPRMITDATTAQLVKVAANSFLATKISFINAMAEICDATGANVTTLAEALGHDDRIGRKFLRAGIGFGGGCLPKDLRAFQDRAEQLGLEDALGTLSEVDAVNQRARTRAVEKLAGVLKLNGARIAVLGGAFKPDSDDVRDSPAVAVAQQLIDAGARVSMYDPRAGENLRVALPQARVLDDLASCLVEADAVAVLTEWKEFTEVDPRTIARSMTGRIVLDGRNALDMDAWTAAGFHYLGMGRSAQTREKTAKEVTS